MQSKRPTLKLFLRIQLLRAGVDRAAIRQALRDDDILDVVLSEIHSTHVQTAALDGMKFLDWLIENADEIIALIMKIISLFGASIDAMGEQPVENMAAMEVATEPSPREIIIGKLEEWEIKLRNQLELVVAAKRIVEQLP